MRSNKNNDEKMSTKKWIVRYTLLPAIGLIFIFTIISFFANNPTTNFNNYTAPISPTIVTTPSVTPTPTPDIDKIPPDIITYQYQDVLPYHCSSSFSLADMKKHQELICISTGDWRGFGDIISVPIIGNIYGSVKKITVDGKDVYWNNAGEIYTRLDLKLQPGLNRFLVIVKDDNGNQSEKYIDINSSPVEQNKDVNVNINQ